VVDNHAQGVDADGSGESGNEVSEDEVRTDEGQNSDGDLDAFVSEEDEEENEEDVEAGYMSTEEEEQGQESEGEPEVRVEPQQHRRHEVDDGRGWTKQTNRKKPKKAAKPEVAVAPAKTCAFSSLGFLNSGGPRKLLTSSGSRLVPGIRRDSAWRFRPGAFRRPIGRPCCPAQRPPSRPTLPRASSDTLRPPRPPRRRSTGSSPDSHFFLFPLARGLRSSRSV